MKLFTYLSEKKSSCIFALFVLSLGAVDVDLGFTGMLRLELELDLERVRVNALLAVNNIT